MKTKNMKYSSALLFSLLLVSVFLVLFFAGVSAAETAPLAVIEMNEKSTVNVLANGDASVTEEIQLTATAFAAFKQQYPQLSMFARVFEPKSTPLQIENMDVKLDEFNNKITASYTVKGMAVNNGNNVWGISVAPEGEKVTLSAQTEKALVFTYADNSTGYSKIITTTINVPEGASSISFYEESNKIRYELPYSEEFSLGNLVFLVFGVLALIGAIVNQKMKY